MLRTLAATYLGVAQAVVLLLALLLTVVAFADPTLFDGRDLVAMIAWAAFLGLCWWDPR